MTIWKYTLEIADIQIIHLPKGAHILSAHTQLEQLCLWFHCNPENVPEKRTIAIVGTGHSMPVGHSTYIGTAFKRGQQLVFHVFELEDLP